jgi:hypothetical protein
MNTKKTGPEVSRIAFDSNSSSSSPSHVCGQRLLWETKNEILGGWSATGKLSATMFEK